MVSFSLPIPTTLSDAIIVGIALIILWVIVSIPVYFAGKLVTTGKASFGDAMLATLGGGIVYFIVFYGVDFFLGVLLGPIALIFGFILALVAWLAIYRASFDTSLVWSSRHSSSCMGTLGCLGRSADYDPRGNTS